MKYTITTKFREIDSWHRYPHNGIDLAMGNGTVLRSPIDGIVEKVVDYGKENIGKGVIIRGKDGNHLTFGHLSDNSQVHIGQRIHEGDILALSGGTGRSSGPHLHFQMNDANGQLIDPSPLVDKVSNYAGSDINLPNVPSPLDATGVIPKLFGGVADSIKENAKEVTIEILSGIGEALVELLTSVTLIGSGVCIILKVCGWRDGGRWAGILIGVNVLLKYLGVRA